jgi:hypothetical protein
MDVLRAKSSAAGDWTIWAECLSEDAQFFDSIYGTYQGKQAVSDFVVRVHAPFPQVRYEREWSVIDVDRSEVIFQQHMILPEPSGWEGASFSAAVWSRHTYAGDGLWSLKHDVTLSASDSGANFKAWFAAGGRFAAPPLAPPEPAA